MYECGNKRCSYNHFEAILTFISRTKVIPHNPTIIQSPVVIQILDAKEKQKTVPLKFSAYVPTQKQASFYEQRYCHTLPYSTSEE